MAKLTSLEKKELLSIAANARIRDDFRRLRHNRDAFGQKHRARTLSEYLRFLTVSNAFANHAAKPFDKMTGSNFRM